MKVLFVTDLHGSKWKYERLFEAAKKFQANVVINGGGMLSKNSEPFKQGEFIADYLDNHFARFNSAGIYYLCYHGNDDVLVVIRPLENISGITNLLHDPDRRAGGL